MEECRVFRFNLKRFLAFKTIFSIYIIRNIKQKNCYKYLNIYFLLICPSESLNVNLLRLKESKQVFFLYVYLLTIYYEKFFPKNLCINGTIWITNTFHKQIHQQKQLCYVEEGRGCTSKRIEIFVKF